MIGVNQDYVNSRLYKIVFLLSGYRSLMHNSATDVVFRIKEYRISKNKPVAEMDKNFMTPIDAGFEILDEEEVKIYADYVADFMKYDKNKFFTTINKVARYYIGKLDEMSDKEKVTAQAEAIYEVVRHLDVII